MRLALLALFRSRTLQYFGVVPVWAFCVGWEDDGLGGCLAAILLSRLGSAPAAFLCAVFVAGRLLRMRPHTHTPAHAHTHAHTHARTQLSSWSEEQTIGDVFVRWSHFFKVYKAYCGGFDEVGGWVGDWLAGWRCVRVARERSDETEQQKQQHCTVPHHWPTGRWWSIGLSLSGRR